MAANSSPQVLEPLGQSFRGFLVDAFRSLISFSSFILVQTPRNNANYCRSSGLYDTVCHVICNFSTCFSYSTIGGIVLIGCNTDPWYVRGSAVCY